MKQIYVFALALLLGTTGCYTSRYAQNGRKNATQQTFATSFDPAWRAAVDAAQMGDLAIVSANRSTGYIHARRTIQPHTFGEDVGMWVTALSPNQTRVEVVSRQAGPPVLWMKNWEKDILNAVAANLTREVPTATGGIGASSYSTTGSGASVTVSPGSTVTVTPQGTTVAPSPTIPSATVPGTTVPTAPIVSPTAQTRADYIAEQQRQLDDLRRQEDLRLKELEREKDITQREKLTTEIERLRGQLRTIADRIAELELQQQQLK